MVWLRIYQLARQLIEIMLDPGAILAALRETIAENQINANYKNLSWNGQLEWKRKRRDILIINGRHHMLMNNNLRFITVISFYHSDIATWAISLNLIISFNVD